MTGLAAVRQRVKDSRALGWMVPYTRTPRMRLRQYSRDLRLAYLRRRYGAISAREFTGDLRQAVEASRGYATAKIGVSNHVWMSYEILLARRPDPRELRQFEEELRFHGLKQSGLFPADPAFYLRFNTVYMRHVRNLDCLGICLSPRELEIKRHYGLDGKVVYYIDQLPPNTGQSRLDGPARSDALECYLPAFRGKKILIVCPFASVLQQRATREIFEGVWSATHKRWFYPERVDALELPYGFARETQERYGTALDLFDAVAEQISKRDFDVALVAAAGLAVPIVSHVKGLGKIGIDLGGHLQVLFGVLGKRWRQREYWMREIWNEHWIDMPAAYVPKEADVCDQGAYW
jgi:hypothetical protein